ncbi:MAG: hypothetical protein LIQ30_11070, partial [Planctomycetes bacterium]|nr:hypothetical protein [Planctomycetota bacterium]
MSVLALDAGTTNFKVAVFSADGPVAKASGCYPDQIRERDVAELNAASAWNCVKAAARRVVDESRGLCDPVTAVSFSSMGEAMVPVTRDRRVLASSLLAVDQRGDGYVRELEDRLGVEDVYRINGNVVAPFYGFSKLMWIKENRPEVYAEADRFLLWADFFGFMLGAEPYATTSLANRTMLFDITTGDWSDDLLAACGLDRDKFGPVVRSGRKVGTVAPALARELGLSGEVDIISGGHDQGCNSLGSGRIHAGDMVVGIGTYETYCPTFSRPATIDEFMRLGVSIEHHVLDGLYVSMMANHSGIMLEWFRRCFSDAGEEKGFPALEREMPDRPTGLLVLPHFEPPQWPEYMNDTSGAIVGLKSSTTRGEIFKALLESITFYFADGLAPMSGIGIAPAEFAANGGGSKSDAWLQIKADIFGKPFKRLATSEGSLCGAAMLAGVKTVLFASYEEAVERLV